MYCFEHLNFLGEALKEAIPARHCVVLRSPAPQEIHRLLLCELFDAVSEFGLPKRANSIAEFDFYCLKRLLGNRKLLVSTRNVSEGGYTNNDSSTTDNMTSQRGEQSPRGNYVIDENVRPPRDDSTSKSWLKQKSHESI